MPFFLSDFNALKERFHSIVIFVCLLSAGVLHFKACHYTALCDSFIARGDADLVKHARLTRLAA